MINCSVRAEVNSIRYQFEVGSDSPDCWIPDLSNLADLGTKPDSSPTSALPSTLLTRKLPFGFPEHEASSSRDESLG